MKRLLLIIMAVVAIGFASCNKDDDNDNSTALVGKWEIQYTMIRNTIESDWRMDEDYSSREMVYVFTKTEYGIINDHWEYSMCIYKLNLDKMEIMLQLAYPNQKIYKLTDTEFELEVEWTWGLEKYVMKRVE